MKWAQSKYNQRKRKRDSENTSHEVQPVRKKVKEMSKEEKREYERNKKQRQRKNAAKKAPNKSPIRTQECLKSVCQKPLCIEN